jgi:glutamine amidotransferase
MIAIVDYGVGNLFSLKSSLSKLGITAEVTADPAVLAQANQIILPGVGAFGDAIAKLKKNDLDKEVIRLAQAGKPLLGICLGMQLLFDESEEFGHYAGLGLIPGKVTSMAADFEKNNIPLKVPHIGWNELTILQDNCPILKNTNTGDSFYYVHSFYGVECEKNLMATSDYGLAVTGVVQNGNIFGTQFHPEKSGQVGLNLLKAFSEVN